MHISPKSKSRVNDMQRRFAEIAADVHMYKRQVEVILVGGFNAGVGRAGQQDGIIGQYGEDESMNGVEMSNCPENNGMKTLNDRAQKPEAKWAWTRK
ncbi:unnamed protein product [Sphacelaria rigidula]